MIGIIDYGLGNVKAFLNVYRRLGIASRIVTSTQELAGAEKLILPGVGHFDHAMQRLDGSGMRDALEARVLGDRVPVLGVCVGMQMLADSSSEGTCPGLGWVPGAVLSLEQLDLGSTFPLPHMGWNDVDPSETTMLFSGLVKDARFYFLHSFYFSCASQADIAATATYGKPFTCAVRRGNVFGAQFHPEKSHHWGARLLKNFAEL
ncbi:imidazole glycerol phosphate synthase subunit HisH [Shinella sumterensis]|uniref:Imidazole glycerol phosphate synthase subunit HisH n=1 Tax=Shinella sumterensis TaxID=1967501 RepID=A0AA50CGS3_9HYPH|nr:imidazole glycerol phosphate synthase subunit HisH [Shinella sumterensis]WLR96195.1 imidazole glycerol phosphate synthase subunit HisH [Shinella sumterensis]